MYVSGNSKLFTEEGTMTRKQLGRVYKSSLAKTLKKTKTREEVEIKIEEMMKSIPQPGSVELYLKHTKDSGFTFEQLEEFYNLVKHPHNYPKFFKAHYYPEE